MRRLAFFLAVIALPAVAQPSPAEQGKAIYDRVCTACHGANGGAGDRAPAIVLAGASGALRGERSQAQLVAIVRDGIPGTGMPAWKGRLSEDDIAHIGAYIGALRGTALDNPTPGDTVKGEAVFWGKGMCGSCHMINGRGDAVGPDLGNIAATRKATAIYDALTKDKHSVFGDGGVHLPMIPPMNYEPVTVVTKAGKTVEGVMRNQDHWSVQMVDMSGVLHSFDRATLRSVAIRRGSVMPSDYDRQLSPEEFTNLMAFLTRQGSRLKSGGDE